MKSYIMLLLSFLMLSAFSKLAYRTINLEIKDKSKISIQGTSNVNSFECFYENHIELKNKRIELLANNNNFKLENAMLHIKANAFDCGGKRINSDFKNLLKTEQFPQINIKVKSITQQQNTYFANVDVEIAGQTKAYQFKVLSPDQFHYTSDLIINISDFELESPKKLMGLIKVDELIDINFDLFVSLN